jgi:hypothetical protein
VPSRLVVPYADVPCLFHDSTGDEPVIEVRDIVEVTPTIAEIDEPAQMPLVADLTPEPQSEALSDAISPSEPALDETILFPATPSVARRAAPPKSTPRSKRKGAVPKLDYGHLAIFGLIALGALAAIGFAVSLVTDTDVAVRQNPQTLARAWAIGITGLLSLSVASVLLFRILNPKV